MSRQEVKRYPLPSQVLGVQHIKGAAFDDDVLLTGANISADYLSNRQVSSYTILYYCTATLLQYDTTTLLHYYTSVPLHYYTAILLYFYSHGQSPTGLRTVTFWSATARRSRTSCAGCSTRSRLRMRRCRARAGGPTP
jgi:hypothetical protein